MSDLRTKLMERATKLQQHGTVYSRLPADVLHQAISKHFVLQMPTSEQDAKLRELMSKEYGLGQRHD